MNPLKSVSGTIISGFVLSIVIAAATSGISFNVQQGETLLLTVDHLVQDPARLRPWLVSVAVNEARQLLRKGGNI